MTLPRALLLDSTFLRAYERELNPRLAQAVVVQAITSGRLLIVPALSLLVAGAALDAHPELTWLLNDPAGPVEVLALSATNALDTGVQAMRSQASDLVDFEVAQILVEVAGGPTAVMTYEPKRYAGLPVQVMDMQPR